MGTAFARDAAMTAVIFGFAASAWFGWAQQRPPARWRPWLIAGSIVSLAAFVAGAVLAWQRWDDGTAFDRDTSIRFGIVVGLEVLLGAAGAVVLAARGRRDVLPAWIALVVGVHLFPVAALIDYPWISVVGALVTLVGLVAVPVARRRWLPVSAVTGVAVGTALLIGALVSFVS
jgi:hypothetical protein